MCFLICNEFYLDKELPYLESILVDSVHPVGEDGSVAEYTLTKISFERIQLSLTGSVVLQWGKG